MADKKASGGKKDKKDSKKTGGLAVNLYDEIILLMILAVAILLLLGLLGFGGKIGKFVAAFMYGMFGCTAFILPFIAFFGTAFILSNRTNAKAHIKIAACAFLLILCCGFAQLIDGGYIKDLSVMGYYTNSMKSHFGGGLIGGILCMMLCPALGVISTYVLFIILGIIAVIVITEKSFLTGVKKGSKKVYDTAKVQGEKFENGRKQRQAAREERLRKIEEQEATNPSRNIKKTRRVEKKVKGVTSNVQLARDITDEEVHEITDEYVANADEFTGVINNPYNVTDEVTMAHERPLKMRDDAAQADIMSDTYKEELKKNRPNTSSNKEHLESANGSREKINNDNTSGTSAEDSMVEISTESIPEKEYEFPSVELLYEDKNRKKGNSDKELKETAVKLQQTLRNFGVNVTVTNISCGPSVTRYELQPEQGVKVSKIVSLSDDIKLNLAASDIRIEAPIPGKAAVGIEVPNKENSTVTFRELVDTDEFRNAKSKLTFAVGKDIGGKVVITDIAKMPHLLIAGATGSGKSECINTLIMSILYKAKPSEVRLIMIDPKVVELSIYNGIPHLLIPVVTDPKKAAGALNWAVAEMTDRYHKFADLSVRDIKGYNEKVSKMSEEDRPEIMPQIVIIVDELADLMMVAPGDVEDAICRLAQLARAAGIHLVIATQRPSVNVITGLIKANVPSRIAFSVSSGVDSRTIIDMVGAEKLLGKGDMLFYPSGYQKPARVQGSYVSDDEVGKVVEFLNSQGITHTSSENIENKINEVTMNDSQAFGGERDTHFAEAGRFIIEKDKASIGMIQRMYKVGFNRASRIMDQLADAGVVGPEEGTKPRKVLMTIEEFEELINQS